MNHRGTLLIAACGAFVALAVTAVAGTFALYSDFDEVAGNRVAAASVELGPGPPDALSLSYPPLVEDVVAQGELTVDYRGTVAADVTLSLEPGPATEFCVRDAPGWRNTAGLALVVEIGAEGPVNYCSLLDSGPVTIREAVAPGTAPFTTPVDLTLTENERPGAAPVTAVDALVVEASGGFSDRTEGTLTAPVEPVPALTPTQERAAAETSTAPPGLAPSLRAADEDPDAVLDPELIPRECRDTAFRPDQVVVLEPGDSPWTAAEQRGAERDPEPLLIFGTAGADEITGSDAGDCVVGGAGDDTILGGDGDDVLLGGDGVDTLDGGLGDDALFGGAGLDLLSGGDGANTFDGGADRAVCRDGLDGPGVGPGCDPPVVPTTTPAPTTGTTPPAATDPPVTTTTEEAAPTSTTSAGSAAREGGRDAPTGSDPEPQASESASETRQSQESTPETRQSRESTPETTTEPTGTQSTEAGPDPT